MARRRNTGIFEARRRNTGIFETNFPYAAKEPFLVSQLHFMAKAEACEMRALDAIRASKVRETRQFPERPAGDKQGIKIDSLKRPITYPQSREDHRLEREEFLARDLRKEARTEARKLAREEMRKDARKKRREEMRVKTRLLLDIHRQFQTLEVFHLNWRDLADAQEWIAEDNNRLDLTEKLGAGNPQVEKILSDHRQRFPEIREALERYEMRGSLSAPGFFDDLSRLSGCSFVTRPFWSAHPTLKGDFVDYLESVPDDGRPDRKRIEAMKEIEYRHRQALDLLVNIVELDKNISIRPFEPYVYDAKEAEKNRAKWALRAREGKKAGPRKDFNRIRDEAILSAIRRNKGKGPSLIARHVVRAMNIAKGDAKLKALHLDFPVREGSIRKKIEAVLKTL
jgi:hypothetical protein